MRFYAFNNMYLAGIHNGIQADHCKDEIWLNVLANPKSPAGEGLTKMGLMMDFAKFHKTTIILIGGDHAGLSDAYATIFLDKANSYPVGLFREPGLAGAVTSIGIIIPERLYDDVASAVGRAMLKADEKGVNQGNWAHFVDQDNFKIALERQYTDWELTFLKFKQPCPLAK